MAVLSGDAPASFPPLVRRMSAALRHRGPDAEGVWSDHRISLGHQRLAILDLSDGGAQPMQSEDGRYALAFNGEIYNFQAIAEELRTTGWKPRSSSDTEVLLAAICRWGLQRTVEQVDGMFAIALYDQREARLHLVRDRFGEKPLAYAVRSSQLWFASEVRAFEVEGGPSLAVSASATEDYFRHGCVTGTRTIYADVARVPPASIVTFDLNGGSSTPSVSSYWAIPELPISQQRGPGATRDRTEEVREVLETSVRDRLVSDRPLGALLSGGIDSSLTCALAARHVSGPLKTFTMGWDEADHDESTQAATVARALGADHHDVRLGRDEILEQVRALGSIMDEPNADPSLIGVYLVARAARSELVVALSGDGGDEMFGGYNRYAWLPRATRWRQRLSPRIRRAIGGSIRRMAPGVASLVGPVPVRYRPRLPDDKLAKFSRALEADTATEAYLSVVTANAEVGPPRALDWRIAEAISSSNPAEVLWGLRAADISGYLHEDVLAKVDRATMAVSLESRTPFLNPAVAEVAMTMGPAELIGSPGGKLPLRELLQALLPEVGFQQPKAGFGSPVAEMMRGELAALVPEAIQHFRKLQPPRSLSSMDWVGLQRRLKEGDDGAATGLWALLAFDLWVQRLNSFPGWE